MFFFDLKNKYIIALVLVLIIYFHLLGGRVEQDTIPSI